MTPSREKPPRLTGIRHFIAAFIYSINGFRRLWQEAAFRHILLWLVAGVIILIFIDSSFVQYCILLILFLPIMAVEALNTAIECVVDHLAPDWQVFARDAKDLGSFASMCFQLAYGIFIVYLLLQYFGIVD